MALPTFKLLAQTGGAYEPSVTLSGDGRYLAYVSAANIVVVDTVSGTERAFDGVAGSDNYAPMLAAGASAIAYTSAGAYGVQRIAVADLASGQLRWTSSAANGDSFGASLSSDGRYVAFESAASNLVAGDSNGADDVFVKDLVSGAVQCVSLGLDGAGGAQISADGKLVLLHSQGALYAANLASGALTLVAPDSAGHAELSADGRYVAFASSASFANDSNANYDIFRMDLQTGAVQQVSTNAAAVEGAGWSSDPSISADGRYVSFGYDAGDLAGGLAVATNEIYIKDMLTGSVQQVSHGAAGSFHAAISADGAHIAYASYAGLEPDTDALRWDVVLATLGANTATSSGSAAADLFTSSAANDNWNGGAGVDTVAFHGTLADYTLAVDGSSAQVTDKVAARDGSDTLAGVERLQFADTMLALDTAGAGVAGQAYRIYQAAFNRAPDQGGLGYWISVMDHGQSLQGVAQGFVQSAEFAALYGSAPTNAQVVDKLYLNVLHRAGDPGGIAYWNGILDHGQASVAAVLASFSDSPENIAALVGVLDHGVPFQPFG